MDQSFGIALGFASTIYGTIKFNKYLLHKSATPMKLNRDKLPAT